MGTAVSGATIKANIISNMSSIDYQNGSITNDALMTAISNAIADAVNLHTHDFDYTGAGTGSSPQSGTTDTAG